MRTLRDLKVSVCMHPQFEQGRVALRVCMPDAVGRGWGGTRQPSVLRAAVIEQIYHRQHYPRADAAVTRRSAEGARVHNLLSPPTTVLALLKVETNPG